MLATQNIKESN